MTRTTERRTTTTDEEYSALVARFEELGTEAARRYSEGEDTTALDAEVDDLLETIELAQEEGN